jgi:hypothetical protein
MLARSRRDADDMGLGSCKFGVQGRFDHPPDQGSYHQAKGSRRKDGWKEGRQAVGSTKEARSKEACRAEHHPP